MNKKKKILVICHDAGGAEIISAYLKANGEEYNLVCYVAGPAKEIFQRKNIKAKFLSSDKSSSTASEILLKHPNIDALLSGTGWGSFELNFLRKAKLRRIKKICYLDHWGNYRERFGYPKKNWKQNLPDELWVGDKYAWSIAKKSFKNMPIKLVPNLYFKEIKQRYKKIRKEIQSSSGCILFFSEPRGTFQNHFTDKKTLQLTEFDVLDRLLSYLAKRKIKNKIIISPHPSERKDKYNDILSRYSGKLKIIQPNNKDVLRDIARASLVIGTEGMILVIAHFCNKKVVSFIPDKNSDCLLPYDIIKIKRVEELDKVIIDNS